MVIELQTDGTAAGTYVSVDGLRVDVARLRLVVDLDSGPIAARHTVSVERPDFLRVACEACDAANDALALDGEVRCGHGPCQLAAGHVVNHKRYIIKPGTCHAIVQEWRLGEAPPPC